MIENTAAHFYQKNPSFYGVTSKESTDTKDFTDKQEHKVPINTIPFKPISKKTKYTKRNIYKHNVRKTVLMQHQSTITELNKSTGTMTHCGIMAERPFEEHYLDVKINSSTAADRPSWCRQRSAPTLAEPIKLISSDVQYIGNISLLPEKEPRGKEPGGFIILTKLIIFYNGATHV